MVRCIPAFNLSEASKMGLVLRSKMRLQSWTTWLKTHTRIPPIMFRQCSVSDLSPVQMVLTGVFSCIPAHIARIPADAVTSALAQVFSKRVIHDIESQHSFNCSAASNAPEQCVKLQKHLALRLRICCVSRSVARASCCALHE